MTESVYSEEYKRFTALLRSLRQEAGLTQTAVADSLGVPQSYVSKYETGERRLDVVETARVARALGHTLESVASRLAL